MTKLQGRRALVTGASRGIGAEIVRRLAADGADVAFTYGRSAEEAEKLVAEVTAGGGTAVAIQADSADAEAVATSVDDAAAQLGGLDILVNNAGIAVIATGKYGHPRDIAGVVSYLAGPDTGYITGAHWDVDGGFTV